MTVITAQNLTLPAKQWAGVSHSAEQGTVLEEIDVLDPQSLKPGEALVKLQYAGICGSAYHQASDHWDAGKGGVPRPLIAGDEGVGIIVAINDDASKFKVGDTVGLKFVAGVCNSCKMCLAGLEMICPEAKYTGRGVAGTFQQYSLAFTSGLTRIPKGIAPEHAAPLLCAGVTVWRALKDSGAKVHDWVAVTGAGGGLGSLAVQYAVYLGLNVVAIDSGEEKRKICSEIGAKAFIDFKESADVVADVKAATSDGLGVQAAILCSNEATAYKIAMDYLRPTGRAMIVGLPPSGSFIPAECRGTAIGMKSIQGCFVGGKNDMQEAIDIVAQGYFKPVVEVKPFDQLQPTYDRMKNGTLVGRVVLDLWDTPK